MIERLKLKNFTAFKELDMEFAPGVNLFIGANGTGKTHILKAMYALLNIYDSPVAGVFVLNDIFLPDSQIDNLRTLGQKKEKSELALFTKAGKVAFDFSSSPADVKSNVGANRIPSQIVFIPTKEMLSSAPGFSSLYKMREIHFDETYPDIISKAFLAPLRELSDNSKVMMTKLQKLVGGEVFNEGEKFFVKTKNGKLVFDLLAEGLRKLALMWLLIRNGCLSKGSVLFWDEPEANLNPELLEPLVDILLELQRLGVQMFLATHDYALLKLFDLKKTTDDTVRFFSLFKDKEKGVDYTASEGYLGTLPNPISEASERLFVLEVQKRYKAQQQ